MTYFRCNRCGRKGVYVVSGIGSAACEWPDGEWWYRYWFHLHCRYCKWRQYAVIVLPAYALPEALGSAVRQFGTVPGVGIEHTGRSRDGLPRDVYVRAGGVWADSMGSSAVLP